MKKIRALIAFACALVATLALAVPAFAAGDGPYTLTIRSETPGHTYEAYRVFAGDVGTDGKTLSNVSWGEGVDGAGILAGLKKSQDFGTPNPFADCDSAAEVAAELSEKDAAFADSFAEVVGAHLVTGEAISFGSKSGAGDAYEYTATGLEAGYYLVQDKAGSPSDSQYAKTKFILEVVANVTAEAKADHPTLDKTIVSVEGEGVNPDYANAAIGDKVTFQLTSRVPEMDGYNKYLFAVTDTLAKGFTLAEDFDANSVIVKIGDTTLTAETDYTVKVSGNVITIELTNLLAQRENADKSITITYSATVNDQATIGADGNTNTAYLQFSNDPNHEYMSLTADEGHLGKTPDATVYVYVGGLVLGTRGFHLDGLADTCDGWGGGWTRERTLEIMRDSHLGTFGALALGLAHLAKWLGATLILGLGGWPLLLLIPLWSRVIMVGQAAGNAYARPEEAQRLAGLIVSATGWNHLLAALGLALSLVGLGWLAGGERLGPLWWSSNWRFLGWGGIAALLIALGARRRLGGVTGDILGATLEVAEAVGLVGGALYLLSLGGAPGALLG